MKVAIVCDWLVGTGGAERVVLELHHLYPDAPIYTSVYDPDDKAWFGRNWFAEADVRTLWTQKFPKRLRKFMAPLRALAFSRLDLGDYDLVISSSGAEAKAVRTKPGAVHVSYCHAPTHYYWSRYEEYMKEPGLGWLNPLGRLGLWLLVKPMRRWDFKAAQRADYLIANSEYTRETIKKYYGRQAEVIHPPVDVERFNKANQPTDRRNGFVTAGRFTPYKRIGLAVRAAKIAGLPLLVVGRGPDNRRLERMAGRNTTFLSQVTDARLPEIFGGAKGFIFPGIDDFGIVAVEAMAAGTPVLAFSQGGALDYVTKTTGRFFNRPKADVLAKAMTDFAKQNFDHQKIIATSRQFSAASFREKVGKFIKEVVK